MIPKLWDSSGSRGSFLKVQRTVAVVPGYASQPICDCR